MNKVKLWSYSCGSRMLMTDDGTDRTPRPCAGCGAPAHYTNLPVPVELIAFDFGWLLDEGYEIAQQDDWDEQLQRDPRYNCLPGVNC